MRVVLDMFVITGQTFDDDRHCQLSRFIARIMSVVDLDIVTASMPYNVCEIHVMNIVVSFVNQSWVTLIPARLFANKVQGVCDST